MLGAKQQDVRKLSENKIYRGKRAGGGTVVTVNSVPLDPHSEARDFRAEEFEWGYEGAGPRQLAFALLADAFGQETAFERYRQFLHDVIAEMTDDDWTMTPDDMGGRSDGDQGSDDGIVYVDMDLETLLKKVRGEI